MKSTNPPGRPPIDRADKSTYVTIALPGKVFDALDRVAGKTGTNVPTVIRQRLGRANDDEGDE